MRDLLSSSLVQRLMALLIHRHAIRYAAATFMFTTIIFLLYHGPAISVPTIFNSPPTMPDHPFWSMPSLQGPKHPIDDLIITARDRFDSLIIKRSTTLDNAAASYRIRRGRHPPPGFSEWFQRAQNTNAIVVEEFFDRVYDDLNPFWAMPADEIRSRANSWFHVVRVRNGVAEGDGDTTGRVPWLNLWTDLVAEAAEHLPDVDMPINYMDESRVIAPWEQISKLVDEERNKRKILPTQDVIREYSGLAATDAARGKPYDPKWISNDAHKYWDHARIACPPGSSGRESPALESLDSPPNIPGNEWKPDFAPHGFISNFTASQDICTQGHLRGLHGSFIEAVSMSNTKELIPLFGGCKLRPNNEILIPGAMYLTKDAFYSGGEDLGPPWEEKQDGIIWRGMASGGRHKKTNWRHFHRLRLVEMLNGTTVETLEHGQRDMAGTFGLPDEELYPLSEEREGHMGEWLSEHASVGFIKRLCFPKSSNCTYFHGAFGELDKVPMKTQYTYKFLPDADGNSFSARFRGFLRSSSLPIKGTIYAEWHDDRLIPWLHFVPMDNTYRDLYAILDWLTKDERGDAAAAMIADAGAWWAAQVLRREDMLLYVWRLLLEWARVCDDNRDRIGWVDDIEHTSRFYKAGHNKRWW
ncbi:glycosyltransferase family 90 protein [Zalerion maritima]|uniref:Glycosyltransferase family 90 protein n=1 Tax=Zalerion maritima TaxID=339359 RepID=A0AAD5RFP2_9PEZI|nr:glycosyltransferase family 90 protein [Zalerion maritima]